MMGEVGTESWQARDNTRKVDRDQTKEGILIFILSQSRRREVWEGFWEQGWEAGWTGQGPEH